ncbi:restriction endonuclease subunit S [Thiomicrospira sp. WB1]|uniref:restriction endonuclease subunit S n=1 Tax=Thiomicrospira sp. WB1 TaxID=1685380 RepID=UPI0007467062|nr:restriction endonuclease subunit S [Thiomicrospira sp. WB1]KUJ71660.1 hypothetical protein AVO41_09100 [Thiomicrospira sp. WB1]
MSKYKPYPAYKDSGIEWLGEIPEHWEIKKLRYFFRFSKGLTITRANLVEEGIPCVSYGEVHSKFGFQVDPCKDDLKCVPKDYLTSSPSALLNKNDFIFADTSEDLEGAGNFTQLISYEPTFAGYHTIIARIEDDYHSRYVAYLFDSQEFRSQIQLAVKGVKVFSITQVLLRNSLGWLPTLKEQKEIANFLDQETTKIDTLIEKQQKLIELLKEKIVALAMREQINGEGIEERLRHLVEVISRPVTIEEGIEYESLGLYNRGRGLFHKPKKPGSDMGDSEFFYVEEGDLIISGQFAWEGAVTMATEKESGCVVSHRYPVVRGKKIDTEYLLALLFTEYGGFLLNESSRGSAGRNRPLNLKLLLNEKIRIPSLQVQSELKRLVKILSTAELKAQQAIDLLKERKTALISAAVTGKIDVRDCA